MLVKQIDLLDLKDHSIFDVKNKAKQAARN